MLLGKSAGYRRGLRWGIPGKSLKRLATTCPCAHVLGDRLVLVEDGGVGTCWRVALDPRGGRQLAGGGQRNEVEGGQLAFSPTRGVPCDVLALPHDDR